MPLKNAEEKMKLSDRRSSSFRENEHFLAQLTLQTRRQATSSGLRDTGVGRGGRVGEESTSWPRRPWVAGKLWVSEVISRGVTPGPLITLAPSSSRLPLAYPFLPNQAGTTLSSFLPSFLPLCFAPLLFRGTSTISRIAQPQQQAPDVEAVPLLVAHSVLLCVCDPLSIFRCMRHGMYTLAYADTRGEKHIGSTGRWERIGRR